jgi:IMP dehydrogenase/GMP reductase
MIMESIRKVLSFNDILLVPGYSPNKHIDDANIKFNFKNLPSPFESVPIFNSPMDMVCSKELLSLLHNKYQMPVTIHRYFNSINEQLKFIDDCKFTLDSDLRKVFVAVGSIYKWKEDIDKLIDINPCTNFSFLIDMANGNCIAAMDTVEYIRKKCPRANIMAGNIATKGGMLNLYKAGTNLVRAGIGSGCFTENMKVLTDTGYKKIKFIKIGDYVYSHLNRLSRVVDTLQYEYDSTMFKINGIECTANHEYYVIHKTIENEVSPENIHTKAMWVSADQLNYNYRLVKFQPNFELVKITSIQKYKNTGKRVYDLTVKDDHSYNIEGIIVHNSICSTRTVTGFGVPVLTTLIDCKPAKADDLYLISDGGIEYYGDINKAIFGGADAVMIGKLFAATNLSPGAKYDDELNLTENEDEYRYVEYRGMSSKNARMSSRCRKNSSIEGVNGLIEYTGKSSEIIEQIFEVLKTAVSYYDGSVNWDEFRRFTKAIEMTPAGWGESLTRVNRIV